MAVLSSQYISISYTLCEASSIDLTYNEIHVLEINELEIFSFVQIGSIEIIFQSPENLQLYGTTKCIFDIIFILFFFLPLCNIGNRIYSKSAVWMYRALVHRRTNTLTNTVQHRYSHFQANWPTVFVKQYEYKYLPACVCVTLSKHVNAYVE